MPPHNGKSYRCVTKKSPHDQIVKATSRNKNKIRLCTMDAMWSGHFLDFTHSGSLTCFLLIVVDMSFLMSPRHLDYLCPLTPNHPKGCSVMEFTFDPLAF